jgi:phospholipid/cholesterol/gamma-HCH transport system substrate-binding protein
MRMSADRHPYKVYGAAMLAVMAAFTALSIAIFQQKFTSFVPVTLQIERAGLQLLPGSDVKVRGLVVGSVSNITSDGNGATIKLKLTPSKAKLIPDNVDARLLPKTIFGEKYVDLIIPSQPSAQHIQSGDVIPEDRSTPALEINQALDDLLPLLRTVRPAELNTTLTALATALSGRGKQFGQTMANFDDYLKQINPHLPAMQHDFVAFAQAASTYDQAAPAFVQALGNFTVSARTLEAKQKQFESFLKDLTAASDVTNDLLARNEQNLVQVNAVNKSTLKLIKRYSPEFPCFFQGFAKLVGNIRTASIGAMANVILQFTPPIKGYTAIDAPDFTDNRGPNCYGLPNPGHIPRVQFKDGTEDDPGLSKGTVPSAGQELQSPQGLTQNGKPVASTASSPSMGDAGTPEERASLNNIVGPAMAMPASKVPPVADLLWGPLLRGASVALS